MSKPKIRDPRLTNLADAYEGRPAEDQFDRQRRQDRELAESVAAQEARHRAQADRKADAAARIPRVRALRVMGRETVGRRGIGSLAERRKALRSHPTYQALPASERAAWDAMVDDAHEAIEHQGVAGPTWLALETLANDQADELADWEPATDREDPTALAAMIPRG